MSKRLLLFLFTFFSIASLHAQNVNIYSYINGFKHAWDCPNVDAYLNRPDPRYRLWLGYNSGNLTQVTTATGLYPGCGSPNYTYGADDVDCYDWNPGPIQLSSYLNRSGIGWLNISMQSWESDGCGSNCTQNTSGDIFDGCFWNADDTRCGTGSTGTNIGEIYYWLNPPECVSTSHNTLGYPGYYDFNGDFVSGSFLSMKGRCNDRDGAGYGINKFLVKWNFADPPTLSASGGISLKDNTLGAGPYVLCPTSTIPTLSFTVNSFSLAGWTVGRNVIWQKSTNGTSWPAISVAGSVSSSLNNNYQTTYTYQPPLVTSGSQVEEYYRAVVSSDCDGGFTNYVITNVVHITWLPSTNTLCGAPSCSVAYVDPINGSNALGVKGTPAAPFKTIAAAISALSTSTTPYIRVCSTPAGNDGVETNVCNLTDNMVIEGGYVRGGALGDQWVKSNTAATTIVFSGIDNATADYKHIVAFKSAGKAGWAVKDMTIKTSNAPTGASAVYATNGEGISNYGFLIINSASASSSNFTLSRVNIQVGNAGPGKDGVSGAGYVAGSGGAGGSGGSGSSSKCGGTAGSGSNGTDGTGGAKGTGGSGFGGDGCNFLGCNASERNGNNGGGGANATGSVTSYTAGVRASTPALSSSPYYTVAGQAGNGGNGFGGGGGGGGSGGDVGTCCSTCLNLGNCGIDRQPDGGAGGAGGRGGLGGTGATGGGGSFGIWQYSSNTGASIAGNELLVTVGSAGTGGTGGNGTAGETGIDGAAGVFSNSVLWCAGSATGGNGGKGGNGSSGGRGQDGANGTTAKYVKDGVLQSDPSSSINSTATITVNSYTAENVVTVKACQNSEITLTSALGTWSLPANLSIVQDKRNPPAGTALSNYSTSTNPTKVWTTINADPTTGGPLFFDVIAGGTNFKKALYITPEPRTLPTIVPSLTEICADGTANLSVTGSYDAANIAQREWKVYVSDPNTPFYTAFTSSISVSGFTNTTTTDYIVRYRERHSCCGWSVPVFAKITVYPVPDAPVMTKSPNSLDVCPGVSVSATFTTGNSSYNCTTVYEYSKNNSGSWTTYTPGNSVTTTSGDISVTIRARKNCSCGTEQTASYTWSVLSPLNLGTIVTSISNGVSADQTGTSALCAGTSANPIQFQDAPTGAGGFTYQWYYKEAAGLTPPACPITTGDHMITAAENSTYNSQIYAPGSEVPPGYSRTYACYVTPIAGGVTSTVCGSAGFASGCRKITVLPTFTAGTVSSGDQTGTSAICGSTTALPNPVINSMSVTGATGSGTINYQWWYKDGLQTCPTGSSTSGWTSIANGTPTNPAYTPAAGSVADGASRTYACFVTPAASATSPLCGTNTWATNCRQVTVLPTLTPGAAVSLSDNLCQTTPSATISINPLSVVTAPTGSGGYKYQWFYKQTPGSLGSQGSPPACPNVTDVNTTGWTSAGSASSSSTFTPPASQLPAYYGVTYACWVTSDNTVNPYCAMGKWAVSTTNSSNVGCRQITVLGPQNFGTLVSNDQTICYGANAAAISFSPAPGFANPTYQWYSATVASSPTMPTAGSSVIPTGWSQIGSATGNSYTPTGLTVSTYFAVQVGGSVCGGTQWATGVRTVTVRPDLDKGKIATTGQTICSSGSGIVMTPVSTTGTSPTTWTREPVGDGGFLYQWYSIPGTVSQPTGTSTSGWTPLSSGTGYNTHDFTPAQPGSTTTYACQVKGASSPSCDHNNVPIYEWADGMWVVSTTTPTAPTAVASPPVSGPTYCRGNQFTLVNIVDGSGGIGAGCVTKYRWTQTVGSGATNIQTGGAAASATFNTTSVPIIRTSTANNNTINIFMVMDCGSGTCLSPVTQYTWSTGGTTVSTWCSNSVTPTPVCSGSNVTLSIKQSTTTLGCSGSTANAGITWQRFTAPGGGGSATTVTTPDAPTNGTGSTISVYYRPFLTTSTLCSSVGPETQVSVLAPPVSGTVSNGSTICVGASITPSLSTPGSGTGCSDQYQIRTSTNNGTSWSSYADIANGSFPYTPAAGVTDVQIITYKKSCTLCANSTPSTPGGTHAAPGAGWWVIQPDPQVTATASPAEGNACVGSTLTLTSPVEVANTGLPTSGCTIDYSTDGVNYSSTVPSITGSAVGSTPYIIIRRTCTQNGCTRTGSHTYNWTIVSDPSAPTATMSPVETTVCVGKSLTLTSPVDNGGGDPSCSLQYSTDGGATYSSTIPTITAAAGSNSIIISKKCTNLACDLASTTYTWTGVIQPSASATKSPDVTDVCSGTTLTLTGVTDNGGGTGSCIIEYSTDNGATYTTTFPSIVAVAGTNTIKIRKNCSGTPTTTGCTAVENTYTWTGHDQATAPTATKSPAAATVCEGSSLTLTGINPGSGGSGCNTVVYSVDDGVYAAGVPTISNADVGTHTIQMKMSCTGYGCDNAAVTTYSWDVVADPEAPTATQSPAITTVCAGSTLTLTGVTANNGGVPGSCDVLEYSVDGGTYGGTVPTITNATVGTHTIAVRRSCSTPSSSDCGSQTTTYTWTVVADPTLSALQTREVCKGGSLALFTNKTGGTGTYNYIWQWLSDPLNNVWTSITNGANAGLSGLTYTLSNSATGSIMSIAGDGSEAAGDYSYRVVLESTSSSLACDAISQVGVITVHDKPTITDPDPVTQTICSGGTVTDLSVTASGGSSTPFSYIWYSSPTNTNSGGTAQVGTGGNTFTPDISTAGTTYYYAQVIQPEPGCSNTTAATGEVIVTTGSSAVWTRTPNLAGFCAADYANVSATIPLGGAPCTAALEYEYDNSGTWYPYTQGADIPTTGSHTLIRIHAQGTCGCAVGDYYTTWTLAVKPDPTSANAITTLCGNNTGVPFAVLSANDPSPYTGTWTKVNAGDPGTIANPSNPNTTIDGLQSGVQTIVRWTVDNSGCQDLKDISLTPGGSYNTNIIATANDCKTCMIKNGNTYTFFNSAGHIVAKIVDNVSPTTELANTEVCLDIAASVPTVTTTYGDQQPYLQRRWAITPTTKNTMSHVTLYFTKTEYAALWTAAQGTHYAFSNFNELRVTKFNNINGTTFTDPPNYPATNASAMLIVPVIKHYPNPANMNDDYSAEFDLDNYSTFYIHPQLFPFAPLPVELVSFTGWNEDAVNRLQWVTASEKNTVKFEVEKSLAAATWNKIGEKAASGTSVRQLTYNLTDNEPVVGNNYYRLKIIDNDGKFTYSNVINIPISSAVINDFVRVYPNPTGGMLNVEIQAVDTYDSKVFVYDVLGKKAFEKVETMSKGMNLLQFDFSTLAKGPYIIQFMDNNGKLHTTKFVKED